LGTLLAVLIYFRRDLWNIFTGVVEGIRLRQPLAGQDSRLGWFIILGSIPAVIFGLLFNDALEKALANPSAAALLLLGNALILTAGEKSLRGFKSLSAILPTDAITIGLAQVAALFPGISRSGVTISTGLVRGFDRSSATRFSFLLGVPVIAGAGLIAAVELVNSPDLGENIVALVVTFFTAFIVGYLCIYFLLRWVKNHTLYIFAIYSALAGSFYLIIEWIR
ncbi:MAG: undecaprenyl-diphosphate phosphatase, partial [Candidatus Promineifilaceae bacterium]